MIKCFFLFNHFLEARAKIGEKNHCFFWKLKTPKFPSEISWYLKIDLRGQNMKNMENTSVINATKFSLNVICWPLTNIENILQTLNQLNVSSAPSATKLTKLTTIWKNIYLKIMKKIHLMLVNIANVVLVWNLH